MRVRTLGQVATFQDLQPGEVFGATVGGRSHLGMRVRFQNQSSDLDAVVVLSPSESDFRHRPGMWAADVVRGNITRYTNAELVPAAEYDAQSAADEIGAGDLLIVGEEIWLTFTNDGHPDFVNVATGIVANWRIPPTGQARKVTRWTVRIPGNAADEYEIVCSYPARADHKS